MKTLWRVDVDFVFYVVAENESAAEDVAEGYAAEAFADASETEHLYAEAVTRPEQIARGWLTAIPYGGDEESDATCEQVFLASRDRCPHGVYGGEPCAACLEAAGQLRLPGGQNS